jgi:polar amino acid transport system ATP-binding protein
MKLKIDNLTKSFGDNTVLEDISIDLEDISALVLIGPSGGGKTTFLRILAGLETYQSGEIHINDHHLKSREDYLREYRKKIGMVFQAYNLFPHLTALENIMLPLVKVHNIDKNEAKNRAMELLKRFQLEEHAMKKPSKLSGGQKQRIAICRAVAIKPEFLLLDEPTSALDPEYTSEVLDLIQEVRKEGIEIILVTHEMGFAKELADYIFFVSDRQILSHGAPKDIFSKENKNIRVKSFFDKVLKHT